MTGCIVNDAACFCIVSAKMCMMRRFVQTIVFLGMCAVAFAKVPGRGYRGFVDWNNDLWADISLYGGQTDSRFYTGFSTSHGFQFNRWLFAGGGVAIENFVKENETYLASVYAHLRSDLWFGRFRPHVDVRLGYNMSNYGGVYFCPTIGYRINTRGPLGVNIAFGATLNGNRRELYDYSPAPGWLFSRRRHQYDTTIHIRLGIDFQL